MELNIILLVTGLLAGFITGEVLTPKKKINIAETRHKADKAVELAKEKALQIREKARTQTDEARTKTTENSKTYELFLKDLEKSVKIKEEASSKREKRLEELKLQAAQEDEKLISIQKKHEEIKLDQVKTLSNKAGKSVEDVKNQLVKSFEEGLQAENIDKLKRLESYYGEIAEKYAKNMILETMQRVAMDTSTEKKNVQIYVPKDGLKAELVGRTGENIKELESLVEVSIVFNDFPDTISVSSYSLLQRHIAEIAITRLFESRRRIDVKMVQEAVKFATAEVDKDVYKLGLDAIKKLGIKRAFHPDLVKIVGRLYFRTSYGQNIMRHSMEVTYLANMISDELGLDGETCRIAGFLHDLGKAIDQDPGVTGGHDFITKELMTKYGFSEDEIHAAWAHHESEPARTPEAMVIKAADAISAGRPGARQESIGRYIERIKALEEIPGRFNGVKRAFAISAGREVRVLVDAQTLKDEDLAGLAKTVAETIESEVGYPGKVKINVIRRTQTSEYTR
ncbi:MAG: hypothetical protein US89_C0006G0037 [Candidatus Peregrinibacteria bacterium GW2011_GWF2_38_29]|nr:MAG: hypothetical protein US89_C0006G0037 [Candidatus Peregrinibacteria bacterium GW2011_GWF2_38_29]HBB03228.1 hypothetical protein [Candidatus Peregrinibacteria bacterium]